MWTLQDKQMKQRAKAMRYLKKVEGVLRMDKVKSDDIQGRLRQDGNSANKGLA